MRIWVYEASSGSGVIVSGKGKIRAHLWGADERVLVSRARALAPGAPVEPAPGDLAGELTAYFVGAKIDLTRRPIDLSGLSPFYRAIYQAVRAIPRGESATYGEIASDAGFPGAARAVGSAMSRNPAPLFIPCHRIRAKNGPGGWTGPPGWKARLLVLETLK